MTKQCNDAAGSKKLGILLLSAFLLLGLGIAPVKATISGEAPAGLPMDRVAAGAPQAAMIAALVNAGAASPPAFAFTAKAAPPGPPWESFGNEGIRGDRDNRDARDDRDGRGGEGDRGDRDDRYGKGGGGDRDDRDSRGNRDGKGGRGHRGHGGHGGGTASPCR